jgi:hypothetical protein
LLRNFGAAAFAYAGCRAVARLRDHTYRLACQPKPAASAGEGWWER